MKISETTPPPVKRTFELKLDSEELRAIEYILAAGLREFARNQTATVVGPYRNLAFGIDMDRIILELRSAQNGMRAF